MFLTDEVNTRSSNEPTKSSLFPHQQPKKIKIVVMDEHFLYLPLYYAKHKAFFGFIPKRYGISIVPSSNKTDVSAFQMLMDTTSDANSDVDFAVADPVSVLDYNVGSGPRPVILAELISNTAFWAIDRRTRPINFLKDLAAFDKIIAFHPGTTSYGIASRIFRDAGKTESIKRVQPGQELVALKESKKNTIALSPDILGIDHLLWNHAEYNIDLILGTTPEYNSVLLTALMSRSDVVTEHSDLVVGLLKALQQSMLLIKQQTPDVIRYANDRFEGYGEDHVVRAFHRADEGHVFPTTIEVNEAHWIHAARVSCDANGAAFDDSAQSKAKEVYQHSVQPYSHLTKQAVGDIYSAVAKTLEIERPKRPVWEVYGLPLVWLALGACAARWFHWSTPILVAAALLVGIFVSRVGDLQARSLGWYLHWLFVVSLLVILTGRLTYEWRWDIVIGLICALLLAEVTIIHIESRTK